MKVLHPIILYPKLSLSMISLIQLQSIYQFYFISVGFQLPEKYMIPCRNNKFLLCTILLFLQGCCGLVFIKWLIIGSLRHYCGNICMCLCICEYPELGPQLYKQQPSNTCKRVYTCLKSSIFNLQYCFSWSIVTIRSCRSYIQYLLFNSRCLGGRSVINMPSSKGGMNGFVLTFLDSLSFFYSNGVNCSNMDIFQSFIYLVQVTVSFWSVFVPRL